MAVDEVVVTGQGQEREAPVFIVDDAAIDLASALLGRADVSLSTNSRGETGLAIRGRSEREVRTTINGFLLIDPWDDRLNLANIPGASFSADVSAIGDAATGSGGALHLQTITGPARRATAEAGDFGFFRGHGLVATSNSMVAIEGLTRDGVRAPDGADLPFSQTDIATRTNTDREQISLLAASEGDWRDLNLTGLALLSSASYGVAPEGHLDPDQSNVRFWQIPEDDRLFVAGGAATDASGLRADVKGWLHTSRQKINVFDDASYQAITRAETSSDFALGVDAAVSGERWSAGGSWSRASHSEQETGQRTEEFSRNTYALWGSLAHTLNANLSVTGDVRHEGFATGDTGGRGRGPDLSLTTSRIRMIRAPERGLGWSVTAARIGRLPSQRELYGEALGRFLVNPNLEAERAWLGEGAVTLIRTRSNLTVTTFIERRSHTIDQQIVEAEAGNLRQRINTDGYVAYGLEANGMIHVTEALTADLSATVVEYDLRGDTEILTERPEEQVAATLAYRPANRFDAEVRLRHQSGARSLGDTGQPVDLPSGTAFDLEAGFSFAPGARGYLRLDNAFDAEIVPQLGLPAPGRLLRIGITAEF
ncbi:MAG: TonB-dependent receptor [Pseudomonadota bacterium]